MNRVVITGIGVISPIGIGAKAFFENLLAGKSGVQRIAAFDPGGFPSQIAGEVPAFKIGDYVPKSYRKATKVMARDIELAVVAADDAFKDAGIQSKAYSEQPQLLSERFGCNIGTGLIGAELNELTAAMRTAPDEQHARPYRVGSGAGIQQLTPLWLLKYLPNMLACHVTIVHGLKGPSNTITCADASSHLAMGEAFRTIQRGDADMAICGGAESKVVPMGLLRQCLLKRVTEMGNENPAAAVRFTFDADATGNAASAAKAAGCSFLKNYEHAKKRSAKIYAELVGFGASQDTHSVTTPDPSGHAYGKAITKAIADAKISASDVDLLIPHGLGILSHDRAELAGLKHAFNGEIT